MNIRLIFPLLFLIVLTCCAKNKDENQELLKTLTGSGYSLKAASMTDIESNYQEQQQLYDIFCKTLQTIKENPEEIDRKLAYWKKQAELLKESPCEFPKKEEWVKFKESSSELDAESFYYSYKKDDAVQGTYNTENGIIVIQHGKITFKYIFSDAVVYVHD